MAGIFHLKKGFREVIRDEFQRPFANRDYVFQRKLTFVPNKKTCIISSVATSHPAIPVNKSMHRVTEYWSFMVVKPYMDFNQVLKLKR